MQKLQRDTAAFEQRLEHLGTQLKQKQSELEDAASAYSLLQKQSAASCNELNASLQTAEQRVAALQTDAEAATLQHEVQDSEHAQMPATCMLHAWPHALLALHAGSDAVSSHRHAVNFHNQLC